MLLPTAGCALVAGLSDFHPADGGGGAGVGGAAAGGAAGGSSEVGGSAPGCADHLLITEIRTRGTNAGTDDFVELYNPTDATISLTDVSLSARAPAASSNERWRGAAGDELASHAFFLIAGVGFDDGSFVDASLPMNKSFGDDVLVFLNDSTGALLDAVCVCTTDCASSAWDGCNGVVLDNPGVSAAGDTMFTDESQQRVPECMDSNSKDDFQVAVATPGADNAP